MLGIGMKELIVILIIVLLLFGARRLPEIARSMGKSVKEFKKATDKPDSVEDEEEAAQIEEKSDEEKS